MKYGFIGCGNMAGAIVKSCLEKNYFTPESVWICEKSKERLDQRMDKWGAMGVHGSQDYEQCIAFADVLIIGIKPNDFNSLFKDIGELLQKYQPVLVSIAAGQNLSRLKNFVGMPHPIIRVMPNMNAQVGEGMAAICANEYASREQIENILNLFKSIGDAIEIEEKYFNIVGSIIGCGPAFVFLFIESLARAAQKLGVNKKAALKIAGQTVLGSAGNLLSQTAEGIHPWEMIDQVCSPGGTTIEGICSLEYNGFETAVIEAAIASVNKAIELEK
jgi:pyrroline-5-carboxylate reductase